MQIEPIGHVSTPFKQKFGIPRQACLIKNATAEIHFLPPYNDPQAFEGLLAFSHIWLQFGFDQHYDHDFKPRVRPPRLGGNEKLGVFATRSSFRPNRLGLSLVELLDVIVENNRAHVVISCPDLLDRTPVFDIKPYIAYSDQATRSESSYASVEPERSLGVKFSASVLEKLNILENSSANYGQLIKFIREIISLDPRPAYKPKSDLRTYGIRLHDLDIKWVVRDACAEVIDVKQI